MANTPTEWLDTIGPVVKDTTVSYDGIKWATTTPSTKVSKYNSLLHVLPFNQPKLITGNVPPLFGGGFFSYIIGQFNYTSPHPFTLLDYNAVDIHNAFNHWYYCFPVIRFRVGTVVTRYVIDTNWYSVIPQFKMQLPLYTGQIIKPQFTLEIWTNNGAPQVPLNCYNLNDLYLRMSMLNNPDLYTGQPSSNIIEPNGNALFTDLFKALPQALPINWNPSGYWNSN